jgi:hypothetical protein
MHTKAQTDPTRARKDDKKKHRQKLGIQSIHDFSSSQASGAIHCDDGGAISVRVR